MGYPKMTSSQPSQPRRGQRSASTSRGAPPRNVETHQIIPAVASEAGSTPRTADFNSAAWSSNCSTKPQNRNGNPGHRLENEINNRNCQQNSEAPPEAGDVA